MYVQGEEKVVTGEMTEDEMEVLVFERFRQKANRYAKVMENHVKTTCLKPFHALS